MRREELGESGLTLEEILADVEESMGLPPLVTPFRPGVSLVDIMAEYDLTLDEAELVAEKWLELRREKSRE